MINVLSEKIKKSEAPIVVGLDPTMKLVPEHIKKQAFSEYGESMKGAAEAILTIRGLWTRSAIWCRR